MNTKHIRLAFAIILAAFHFFVSVALAILGDRIGSINNELIEIMIMAILFVQCSLLATWAVLGSGPSWLRIPMSFLLLLWSAFCLWRVMDSGLEPEMIASLAMMMFLQFFCITFLIHCFQIVLNLLKMDSYLEWTTRFSMSTLMIVTTLIAVAVGIGKFFFQEVLQLSWESLMDLGDDFWIFPFLSGFNALAVVLILPALWCPRWQMKLILAIPLALSIAAFGVFEGYLFESLFHHESFYMFLGINLSQAFIFYATMFPLWRWDDQIKRQVENEDTKPKKNSLALWINVIKNIDQQTEQSRGNLLHLRRVCAGLMAFVHIISIIVLVLFGIGINFPSPVIFSGYPTALIGILATIPVLPKKWFWVRMVFSLLLIVPVWLLTMHIFNITRSISVEESAGIAMILFLPFFVQVVILWSIKLILQLLWPDNNRGDSRFSLGFLIIGVSCTAFLFGGARLFLEITGWGFEILQWDFFLFCVVLGIFLAIVSVIALAGIYPKSVSRKVGASLLALIGVWICGEFCYYTLMSLHNGNAGMPRSDLFFLFEVQAIFLMLTVLPFWRWETPLIKLESSTTKQDPLALTPEASSPF